jgi:hypothetical protein
MGGSHHTGSDDLPALVNTMRLHAKSHAVLLPTMCVMAYAGLSQPSLHRPEDQIGPELHSACEAGSNREGMLGPGHLVFQQDMSHEADGALHPSSTAGQSWLVRACCPAQARLSCFTSCSACSWVCGIVSQAFILFRTFSHSGDALACRGRPFT